MKEKKMAVIFPGVGYHADKPLLYCSRKLAARQGYEILCVDYGRLPSGIKGHPDLMRAAYEQALGQALQQLSAIEWEACSHVLFISKSLGTAVAAACDKKEQIGAGHVYYTPVEASFQNMGTKGIVFHGTGDDWARTEVIAAECEKRGLPLFLTEGANHSMETGDTLKDLKIMRKIMLETDRYIRGYQGANCY